MGSSLIHFKSEDQATPGYEVAEPIERAKSETGIYKTWNAEKPFLRLNFHIKYLEIQSLINRLILILN